VFQDAWWQLGSRQELLSQRQSRLSDVVDDLEALPPSDTNVAPVRSGMSHNSSVSVYVTSCVIARPVWLQDGARSVLVVGSAVYVLADSGGRFGVLWLCLDGGSGGTAVSRLPAPLYRDRSAVALLRTTGITRVYVC